MPPFPPQAEANMKKYGKQLMSALPDKTTQVLVVLCTDWVPQGIVPSEPMGEGVMV